MTRPLTAACAFVLTAALTLPVFAGSPEQEPLDRPMRTEPAWIQEEAPPRTIGALEAEPRWAHPRPGPPKVEPVEPVDSIFPEFQALVVVPPGGFVQFTPGAGVAEHRHRLELRDDEGQGLAWFRSDGLSGTWTSPVNTSEEPMMLQLSAEFEAAPGTWVESRFRFDGHALRFDDGDGDFNDLVLGLATDAPVWELRHHAQLVAGPETPQELVVVNMQALVESLMGGAPHEIQPMITS